MGEYEHYDLVKLVKSIAFFRFFLMLLIVYYLSKFDILNFKFFFLSAGLVPVLLSLDIIYQYIFGFDIIGIKSQPGNYNSGFFGDELIAGGFIKNFCFFSIFCLTFFFKKKNNLRFILTILVICILGSGILFSGNRMPLILFFVGLLLIFIISKELKKILFTSFIVLFIIFGFIGSFDSKISTKYLSYYVNAKVILGLEHQEKRYKKKTFEHEEVRSSVSIEEKEPWQRFINNPEWEGKPLKDDFEFSWPMQNELDSHTKLYATALDVWGKNKIFGNGIKSFRQDCKHFLLHKKNRLCSNHPHNYYLEILTDLGILGLASLIIIALLFIIFLVKNYKFLRSNNIENIFLLAATISLILEAFPIKSSGSIFTTSNATYIMLMGSIILSHKKLLKVENFGKAT